MTKPITNEFLESLAFYQPHHLPEAVREIRTNGHELRCWNGVSDLQWTLDMKAVHPQPQTEADVKALLRRIRR